METQVPSRVAAVTGGSGGIGRAILAHLSAAGVEPCSLDLAKGPDGSFWVETDIRDERFRRGLPQGGPAAALNGSTS